MEEAKLNFAAAKLTVKTILNDEALQAEARKIEPVTLYRIGSPRTETRPAFWQAYSRGIRVGVSGLLLLIGWVMFDRQAYPYAQSMLFVSILLGGYAVAVKGARNLLRFDFDMNVLMTVAVTGAMLIGEWKEAAVVSFLFAISEMLETYSMDKARQSIRSLIEITPQTATIIRNAQEVTVPVEELIIGDTILVKPGEKIPIDGEVIDGATYVNQAPITGESMPVEKTAGDSVYAGTLNQQGAIWVRVSKLVQDTAIAKIIHLVEEAQAEKAPFQAFIDRFAKYYTPIVMSLAILIALVPPLLMGGQWNRWIYEGLALLVVGCPCALVVSTPIAIVTAIGSAARNGVLIKGGLFLEQADSIRAIAFDKTGTLTKGEPQVTDVFSCKAAYSEQDVLRIAGSLEKASEHPLAKAILQKAAEMNVEVAVPESFSAIPGKGAKGVVEGTAYSIGNLRLFEEMDGLSLLDDNLRDQVSHLQAAGKTVILLGTGQMVIGGIAARDPLRPESAEALRDLKRAGIAKTILLTGDNRQAAEAVANLAGVDEYFGDMLPEDKLTRIKELKNRFGHVAMVGDGINDAPALAAASLGIAMGGTGTDTALETADIALMGDDLSKLSYTVRLSRAALRIIKQNIGFSLFIKLAAVLLVFPGWLTLWMAILSDMGATILVTLNALRLLRHR